MLQILLLIRDYRAILLWPYRYSIYLTSQSPSTINQQLNTTNVCGDNGLNATFLLSQRNGRKEAGRHTPDLACVCPLLHPRQSIKNVNGVGHIHVSTYEKTTRQSSSKGQKPLTPTTVPIETKDVRNKWNRQLHSKQVQS